MLTKATPSAFLHPYKNTHTQSIQLTSSFAHNLNGCAQILSATLHSMRAQQAQVISKVIKQ